MFQTKTMLQGLRYLAMPAVLSFVSTTAVLSASPAGDGEPVLFKMVVSAAGQTCLPTASGTVTVRPGVETDIMDVSVQGLPANTEFELFVIQVPKAPFGVAWYQGSITTDKKGRGHRQFSGRFSNETFSFAQGSAPAPSVFDTAPFPDGSTNPSFQPVQMYHLGLWFGSSQAAGAASCPATVTPFNGPHKAGIQILNTNNFPDDAGPLRGVTSPDGN
jgi:hypothetical protein